MHLLFGLFFLLFAAVCSSLDSFTKNKKIADYNKSKRPCGAGTEYQLCWQYYKQWRDQVDKPDFRDMIFADMNSYYGVRSWFERPFYLDNEKLMEAWIQTKARLETAKKGKAPLCLTHGTSAASPIPEGNEWACQIGTSPFLSIKHLGYKDSELAKYKYMEQNSK